MEISWPRLKPLVSPSGQLQKSSASPKPESAAMDSASHLGELWPAFLAIRVGALAQEIPAPRYSCFAPWPWRTRSGQHRSPLAGGRVSKSATRFSNS